MDRISLWKERIEGRLREIFKPAGPELLREAMSYYLFQPGKRIRPLFTVAVASALGGDEEDAITVGCTIEMIHNYSLVHDDLPAMDNDQFRRGLPTCHVKYGEAVAILAGDALLSYTFEVLSNKENFRTLSESEVVELIRVIAGKSGAGGMVGGQVLDVTGERDLEKVNLMKTAALFEACFVSGGIVAKRRDLLADLEKAGRSVGLLFQMVDDILDRDGFYELLGEDRARRKAGELYEEALRTVEDLLGDKGTEAKHLLESIYLRIS